MPYRQTVVEELCKQIDREDARTERECGAQLKEIASILLSFSRVGYYSKSELSTTSGRTDLIVFASNRETGGDYHTEAFIWELKAPQLVVFESEGSVRACPTKDLYNAENQLLHYHNELQQNGVWKTQHDIRDPRHVKLGGIIIGRDRNWIECGDDEKEELTRLAKTANQIRFSYYYDHNSIRLLTWDKVVDMALTFTATHQHLGAGTFSTDVSASQLSGTSTPLR